MGTCAVTAREAVTKYAGKLTVAQIAERTGIKATTLRRAATDLRVSLSMKPRRKVADVYPALCAEVQPARQAGRGAE